MQNKNKWLFLICFFAMSSCLAFDYNIEALNQVETGEWFDTNISVYSEESINFTIYSYVYKGFNNVGQGWIANQQQIKLESGETQDIILSDLVKFNTEEGSYNLRVRFKFSETKNITETYNLKVIAKESFKETYLYAGLIALCIVGMGLAFVNKNR